MPASPTPPPTGTTSWVLDTGGLDRLLAELRRRGFRTLGPAVRDGAIGLDDVRTASDMGTGWHDQQSPGHYGLHRGGPADDELFGWAVGPSSPKSRFFPPEQLAWRAHVDGSRLVIDELEQDAPPLALVGVRPCEVAGLAVLDHVLAGAAAPDPGYVAKRRQCFVAVVECGSPSGSCFCASMGTGPEAGGRFDLALTELRGERGHRFLVQVGTDRGAEVLATTGAHPAGEGDWSERDGVLEGARAHMGRFLDTAGLADLLAENIDHPRWAEVAERCLSCGNCTQVCPTCFCSDIDDVTDLAGAVERRRRWSSCFDLEHSHLNGGPVRASVESRYRQWMTHKLSTWWDQYGTSGCVGCGRCLTWCPVGIDLTAEAEAIRHQPHRHAADGALTRAGVPVPVPVPAVRRGQP